MTPSEVLGPVLNRGVHNAAMNIVKGLVECPWLGSIVDIKFDQGRNARTRSKQVLFWCFQSRDEDSYKLGWIGDKSVPITRLLGCSSAKSLPS